MLKKSKLCFLCNNNGIYYHGYFICNSCKSKLKLFTDASIRKYISRNPSFEKEITKRLDYLDMDYIKKRIKLLNIKERINIVKKDDKQ